MQEFPAVHCLHSELRCAHHAPFYKEIEWMKAQGITTGYSDGTFRPSAPVNRDAMAAFFYRAAGSPHVDLPRPATSAMFPPITSSTVKSRGWLPKGINRSRPDGTYTAQ